MARMSVPNGTNVLIVLDISWNYFVNLNRLYGSFVVTKVNKSKIPYESLQTYILLSSGMFSCGKHVAGDLQSGLYVC